MLAQSRKAIFLAIALAALAAPVTNAADPEDAHPPEPPVVPSGPPGAATPGTAETPTQTTVLDSQDVEAILGRGVLSRTGEKMGQIVDMIVDRNGQLRAAVIDFGGFLGVGSRKIAVDWNAVRFVSNGKTVRVVVDLTRDEVTGSPEYKPGEKVVILGSTAASGVPTTPPPK